MVEDKIGTKPYLGIEIDYDKEKTFDKFSLDTLKDRYFWEGETHAQEAFARASVFGATFKGETDFELAQRNTNYLIWKRILWNCMMSLMTPTTKRLWTR